MNNVSVQNMKNANFRINTYEKVYFVGLFKQPQYIFSVLLFSVNNKYQFVVNSDTCSVYARLSINHHLSQTNLATFEKGVYYRGFKTFNSLPSNVKNFSITKKI